MLQNKTLDILSNTVITSNETNDPSMSFPLLQTKV